MTSKEALEKIKEISFYEINKIKKLQLEIFEIEDDDYVDRRKTNPKYNAIKRILNKYSKDEQEELEKYIRWYTDDCYKKLQNLGWVITGGDK